MVVRPHPAPVRTHQAPVLISSSVIRGITVEIRRDSRGILYGVTVVGDERQEWGDLSSQSDEQVRELAAMALALARHGERGDRQSVSTYDSCSAGGGR